ncbi:E3 ubiquitin-protein ligase [Melia azedarach]|uniref:E3 ubiquitin-protein ligase n=1 Tax=Melia azedarach TaxID=155640 RepID=A0ACC1X309_MELAZ|nr:E3 ubiquitin-protein ligase [Melia azedarach]
MSSYVAANVKTLCFLTLLFIVSCNIIWKIEGGTEVHQWLLEAVLAKKLLNLVLWLQTMILRQRVIVHTQKPGIGVAGKNGIYSNNGVHELLECPVCTNLMYPPIHQCPNGHTLCSNCKTRVHNCCPTCRYDLGNIRCLALEKIAESLELPCRYQDLGCHDIFPYYSKLKHEQHCRFRPYNCPYAGLICMMAVHSTTVMSNQIRTEVENATWMLTVFNCFGRQFCLHFEAFQLGMALVYMAFLRFMGDDDEAKKFSYSLEVGANGRRLIWQGVPRSIRDSHRKVRDSQDGLIIQRNLALYFSGGDRQELKLRITGRIWKEE